MFDTTVLLPAHEGTDGPFVVWLKQLGLDDFLRNYPLPTLVHWGWIAPQYRVVFPQRFFEEWANFPYGSAEQPADLDGYVAAWGYDWCVDQDEDLWFLDPMYRSNNAIEVFMRQFRYRGTTQIAPGRFQHKGGRQITPYADYFFRWQGYALVELIQAADCFDSLFSTPDIVSRATGLLGAATHMQQQQSTWPREIVTDSKRWTRLSEALTWLAHLRAFRNANFCPLAKDSAQSNERYAYGKVALAKYMEISAEKLAEAIKNDLLALASDWILANQKDDKRSVWTRRAWPHLVSDIQLALGWLLSLTGRTVFDYIDEWKHPFYGNHGCAKLDDVLPYGFVLHENKFSEMAPRYVEPLNLQLGKKRALSQSKIARLARHLQHTNRNFQGFLAAFHELHDNLSYKPFETHGIDFRFLRPLDHFAMLAINAEGCMRQELAGLKLLDGIPGRNQTLQHYIRNLAPLRGIPQRVTDTFIENRKLTELYDCSNRSDPIGRIESLGLARLVSDEACLVKAFLCCVLARNYFAHHDFLNADLLGNAKAGFLLGGILVSVLVLLDPGTDRS